MWTPALIIGEMIRAPPSRCRRRFDLFRRLCALSERLQAARRAEWRLSRHCPGRAGLSAFRPVRSFWRPVSGGCAAPAHWSAYIRSAELSRAKKVRYFERYRIVNGKRKVLSRQVVDRKPGEELCLHPARQAAHEKNSTPISTGWVSTRPCLLYSTAHRPHPCICWRVTRGETPD